jgi:hypothetical protein
MKKLILGAIVLMSASLSFSQNAIAIGESSNAYGMLRTSQNQVFVDPSLNVVGFIYRQNIAVWGGGAAANGKLRYTISTDGGTAWNTDLGPLNATYTKPSRYPEAFLYNPAGNTSATGAYIVWSGPTIPANFDGIVTGTCQVSTTNPITTTENYQFANTSSLIPGGLCQSTPGVFWMVDNSTMNDTSILDSINVYKGTFSAGDVSWVKHGAVYSPHNRDFDGKVHYTGPNMAFSPNGQTGYIVFLGDIGTADSTYNPVIYKSTDAGATWGAANELIVDNIPSVADSIKQFLFETATAIESASEVATAFECDIAVDATGNLHIFTTICAVERRDTLGVVTGAKSYVVYSGYPKNAVDIYSTDGGATWTSLYVAQVNTFRTDVLDNPGTLSIDCYNQISTTADGTIVFYSWSDTDTLIHQGATDNEAPNTFIAGFNTTNGKRTCWKQISDVTNEDMVITPTMAPYVLEANNGGPQYTLAIVTQDVPVDAISPTNYYYVGRGAKFCDEDFRDPSVVDLSWNSIPLPACYQYASCFAIGLEEEQGIQFNLYPNPTTDLLNIQIQEGLDIRNISLINNMGQVVRTIKPGDLIGGTTLTLDVTGLAAGMYTINMSTSNKTYAKKFTVAK